MAEVDEYDVVRRAAQGKAQWICITGGEPLEQDIQDLVKLAHDNGFKVQLETSGMYMQDIVKSIDHVCVSPKQLYAKKGLKENTEILHYTHEVKCVITKEEEIDYYVKHYAEYEGSKVFQPVDNKPEFAEMILKRNGSLILKWKLQIQQHKILKLR